MKVCSCCGVEKELSAYYHRRRSKDGRGSCCIECSKIRQKEYDKHSYTKHKEKKIRAKAVWYSKNREKYRKTNNDWASKNRDKIKNKDMKRLYNITLEEYDALVAKQNGVCAICGKTSHRALHIDHDHLTDKVRELLCTNCNTALGLIKEDIKIAEAMIEYIKKHA